MRVIGGSARGRPLVAPNSPTLRPTADRVREAIFDILGSLGVVEGATVLDLFAGTGALGIEALSRGAERATFVERERRHVEAIVANLASTGLDAEPHEVLTRDVLGYLAQSGPSCSLCLVDPPYDFEDWPALLEVLPGELVVLESRSPIELGSAHELHRQYRYGTTLVTVARRTAHRASGGDVLG